MKLTKKAKEYLYSVYGREENALGELFPDLPCILVIKALNYAAECDEAHPDKDFINGALWSDNIDWEVEETTLPFKPTEEGK